MKRTTRAHLAVARENVQTCQSQDERRQVAAILRYYRREMNPEDARRMHRKFYGPLVALAD